MIHNIAVRQYQKNVRLDIGLNRFTMETEHMIAYK